MATGKYEVSSPGELRQVCISFLGTKDLCVVKGKR